MKIRKYTQQDYKLLNQWFEVYGSQCPPENMFSEETTFIIEDTAPLASITVYLTNVKGFSVLEHFVANPSTSKEVRNQATKAIVDYSYGFLKNLGYKHVVGFATNEKLQERYIELNMVTVRKDLISMVRSF